MAGNVVGALPGGCAGGFYCAGLSRGLAPSHYVRIIGGVQRSTSRRARTVQQYNRGGPGLCRDSSGETKVCRGAWFLTPQIAGHLRP